MSCFIILKECWFHDLKVITKLCLKALIKCLRIALTQADKKILTYQNQGRKMSVVWTCMAHTLTNSEIPNESQRLIHKSGNPLVSPY
jgi:hypothetical protein